MSRLPAVFLASAVSAAAYADLLTGPVSEYYLVSGDQRRVDVVQGGNINRTWTTPDFEYPVAVANTVRTLGARNRNIGREYTLAGNATGNTYPNHLGDMFWDSTTDGQSNYLVSWSNDDVIRTDADYTNPVVLFNLGGGPEDGLGITYDPTNNSLWIADFKGGSVENRALDGTLLSAFNTGISDQAALALDHADGTLWIVEWTQNGDFRQFSKAGALLSTQHYGGLVGVNPLGGEFQIPEPTTLCLLLTGGLFGFRRR